jgi:TP901 family phage tail tape measure protein
MPTIYSIALKLSLEGVNQLKEKFSIVTQEIRKSSSGITNIAKNSFKQLKELATSNIGQLVSLGAATVALKNSIKTGIEFEDTFLRATAKIKDGVKKDSIEFKRLENLVLDLGAKTEFSTTQAGQGLDFWAKAGKTTNEIMELLPKSFDMATASGLDLSVVSGMLADSLGLFNLNSKDMNQLSINTNRIMDNLSKTITMSNVSIEELFETSKLAGGIFTTAGQSIETFNASVAILADNSLKGSMAGTTLRSIMARLTTPLKKARYVLDKLNITIKDSKGNTRDFADIIDDLKEKTKQYGNAEQLAIFKILAGQEAMNGLNFLVKEGGDKLRYYRQQLEESNNTTKELANTFRQSTKITLDNFTSAIEGLAISLYKYLNPTINVILKTMTGIINLFNTITQDSKILKYAIIMLGIAILYSFAPLSAVIIGITLLFAGLVNSIQYCYKKFEWFKDGINAGVSFIKDVFFYIVNTIKQFIDLTINTFKSFSDGIWIGFKNIITLINHAMYTLLITPIKWILIALSKLPSKLGEMGKAGLDALSNFENNEFKYSFNKDNSNGKNNIPLINNIPTAKDVTPAVMQTKYGSNDSQNNTSTNPLLNNTNTTGQKNNAINNQKSVLDININAPKQYNTSYSLNNPYDSGLMINVGNGQ